MSSHKPSITGSPCVRNCCLDNNDVCIGCFRSLAEIMEWHTATEMRRKQILENSVRRKKEAHQ
ncbi:DUF1289 domain-containing protein [Spartinivicinus poritis]|uniref:DUF1289 domain-containing protein n=1 Tax=Spartinivicinus poritis TaxID=2994640 RepID=A0ABT5UBS4_9GAMM|nr:DUF1289 domain-containing protein [Spartinivicinus sp. A2-2]MDE1463635.1 DUF1289 domain-containing protein [Spartinivicinus sp. A2-2]